MTTKVQAHYADVTIPLDTQEGSTGNVPPWSLAAYQLVTVYVVICIWLNDEDNSRILRRLAVKKFTHEVNRGNLPLLDVIFQT